MDFRGVGAPYAGRSCTPDIPERGVKVDNWGIHRRWVEHESGGYWDYCDFPLREADEETVADWPMPIPDDFDYCRRGRDVPAAGGVRRLRGRRRHGRHHQRATACSAAWSRCWWT